MGIRDGCLAYLKVFPSVTAPREFHPPAVCRALPIACDAFNARTVAVREYLFFCVSSPIRCQTHFTAGVVIARSIYRKSWRTCRSAQHRRDVSICLILRRNYPPGFLFQSAGASMPDRWGKEREGNLPRRS